MRGGAFILSAAVLLLLITARGAYPMDDQLKVVQDESSMEQVIERYLTNEHKLIVTEKINKDDKNDMYLELPFKGDPMPKFRMTIDTQSLNTDKDTNKIIERGVLVNLYTDIRVPAGKRGTVQDVINDWNRKKAFASVFIDSDGEIICCWILNVLDEGLATEYVYDVVARLQNIWKGLYPLVQPVL